MCIQYVYFLVIFYYLCELKLALKKTRYYTQRVLSLWKICVFMVCIIISLHVQDDNPFAIFTSTSEAFAPRNYSVYEVSYILKILKKQKVFELYTFKNIYNYYILNFDSQHLICNSLLYDDLNSLKVIIDRYVWI